MTEAQARLDEILNRFEENSGLSGSASEVTSKAGEYMLVIKIAHPTERLFEVLEEARKSVVQEGEDPPLAILKKESRSNLLSGPEGQMFLRTLAEIQNINRYSFERDFTTRYIRSVFGAESQITSSANHVVYGRRGAGKSMLLLYALHARRQLSMPSVWVDMQVYSRRDDEAVISDVLRDILEAAQPQLPKKTTELQAVVAELQHPDITKPNVRRLLPRVRRLLGGFAERNEELFIFLDDFHVVGKDLQPELLDVLYAIARGNRIYLKLSAIESLTRTYSASENVGLQIPHDAQVIPLDYNLTMPDKATAHIAAILDTHARYCGLPSIRRLCTSADVLPRLTWVAAGVPRDALNLFSRAMTMATMGGAKRVSVSNVNSAASETLSIKLRDLETDAPRGARKLQRLVEKISAFCVTDKRKNAFLVEIKAENELFEGVRALVDLRLLHVIREGVTIGEAGRKYLALILDYGFYTGIRAAQSVDLFNRQSKRIVYRELRGLPVFHE